MFVALISMLISVFLLMSMLISIFLLISMLISIFLDHVDAISNENEFVANSCYNLEKPRMDRSIKLNI